MDTLPNIQPYTIEPVQDPNAYNQQDYTQIDNYNPNAAQVQNPKRKFPVVLILAGLVLLGLLILGLLLLTGGGGNNTNNNTGQTTGLTNENVTLQWWGAFLDADVVQPLIDDYKVVRPNVTINYANRVASGPANTSIPSYKSELDRVLNSNDSVELPDIFMVENTWAGDYEAYSRSSTTYDISNFAATFYPAVSTDFASSGQVFGAPMWMDSLVVVYNKEMLQSISLDEPPTSWTRFKNAAEALTVKNGNFIERAGFAGGLSSNVTFSTGITNLLLRQNGVDIIGADGLPQFASDDDSLLAFQFYKSFAQGSNSTWDANQKNESASFLEGNAAMIITTGWRLREIVRVNEQEGLGIDIGISQLPQIDGQPEENMNWATYWGNMVTLNRPYAGEAWAFIEWLNDSDQQRKLSENIKNKYGYFGTLYTRQDMQSELLQDEYLSYFASSLPTAQSWYMVDGLEVEALFDEVLNGDVSQSTINRLEEDIIEIIATKGTLNQGDI